MKFAAVPIAQARGAIVAHAVRAGDFVLKKGDIVSEAHIEALRREQRESVTVAQLEPDDIGENEAARTIAAALGGAHVDIEAPFTGRSNMFARTHGVLRIDASAVDRINDVDEAVTVATLPAFRTVVPGEMIGTVKIIPFAVPRGVVESVLASATADVVDVAPFRPMRVAVISTVMPGLKAQVITKTLSNLADRLKPANAPIVSDLRVDHSVGALSAALREARRDAELIVVFGASAITDRRDIIPAALLEAGGSIEQFGMPVDPGNLLLLGALGGVSVIGAPGCARSPKENGFDWVLHRLLAGIPVTARDLKGLGVGGLLMEIVTRPQPRVLRAETQTRPGDRPKESGTDIGLPAS